MVSQERYGIEAFGWVSAATFVGSVLGSVVGARITSKRPGLWAMNALAPCLLTPVCLVVEVPLWGFCAAVGTSSVGVGCFMVLWYSSLQNEFPEEVQGRVFLPWRPWPASACSPSRWPPLLLVALMGIAPFAIVAVIVLLTSTYVVLIVPGAVQLASPTAVKNRLDQAAVTTIS